MSALFFWNDQTQIRPNPEFKTGRNPDIWIEKTLGKPKCKPKILTENYLKMFFFFFFTQFESTISDKRN